MDAEPVAAVSLRAIHKAFGGVHAVQDMSLDLYAGEVAEHGHHFAGVEVEAHAVDGADTAEGLFDVAQLHEDLVSARRSHSGRGHAPSPVSLRYSTSNTTAAISTWPMIT